jgi:hypothetical protein
MNTHQIQGPNLNISDDMATEGPAYVAPVTLGYFIDM